MQPTSATTATRQSTTAWSTRPAQYIPPSSTNISATKTHLTRLLSRVLLLPLHLLLIICIRIRSTHLLIRRHLQVSVIHRSHMVFHTSLRTRSMEPVIDAPGSAKLVSICSLSPSPFTFKKN